MVLSKIGQRNKRIIKELNLKAGNIIQTRDIFGNTYNALIISADFAKTDVHSAILVRKNYQYYDKTYNVSTKAFSENVVTFYPQAITEVVNRKQQFKELKFKKSVA